MTRTTGRRLSVKYLVLGALAVVACKPTPLVLGPAANSATPVCSTDCKEQWERAQLWLVNHAAYKIQTATDVILETYKAEGGYYTFRVTKEPVGGGKYRIVIRMGCVEGAVPWQNCDPTGSDLTAAFNYYVATGNDILAAQKHGASVQE